jgi:hypothetical protein
MQLSIWSNEPAIVDPETISLIEEWAGTTDALSPLSLYQINNQHGVLCINTRHCEQTASCHGVNATDLAAMHNASMTTDQVLLTIKQKVSFDIERPSSRVGWTEITRNDIGTVVEKKIKEEARHTATLTGKHGDEYVELGKTKIWLLKQLIRDARLLQTDLEITSGRTSMPSSGPWILQATSRSFQSVVMRESSRGIYF